MDDKSSLFDRVGTLGLPDEDDRVEVVIPDLSRELVLDLLLLRRLTPACLSLSLDKLRRRDLMGLLLPSRVCEELRCREREELRARVYKLDFLWLVRLEEIRTGFGLGFGISSPLDVSSSGEISKPPFEF